MKEDLIAEAELGDAAKKFKESELGRVLIGIAHQDAQIALEALGSADPEDAKKIRELQNEVKLSNQFEQWLDELIDKGNTAVQIYQQQES
mgnify:CR=1 FL=1